MRSARTVVATLVVSVLLAFGVGGVAVATAQPAIAQTSTSTTVRMATDANAVTTSGSPVNRTGTWVFLGVCGVIVGVAVVLFVNHRRTSPD